MNVHYHHGKANEVINSRSRISMGSVSHVEEERVELAKDVDRSSHLVFCLISI